MTEARLVTVAMQLIEKMVDGDFGQLPSQLFRAANHVLAIASEPPVPAAAPAEGLREALRSFAADVAYAPDDWVLDEDAIARLNDIIESIAPGWKEAVTWEQSRAALARHESAGEP